MTTIRLTSAITLGATLPTFTQTEAKNEPMLFNCTVDAAFRMGGPITRAFLMALPECRKSSVKCVIDTRTLMLMPGFYPCIPGWHHDDVPRTRADGQPEYTQPVYKAQHAMALVGADVARTEFALGTADFDVPESGVLSGPLHDQCEQRLLDHKLERWSAPMSQVIYFDWQTWHRGVTASGHGWRWFGRISWNTDRAWKCTNELRAQAQVYLDAASLNAGW